jgi:hypothetical protein
MADTPETITQIEEYDRDIAALERAVEGLQAKRKVLLYANEQASAPASSASPSPRTPPTQAQAAPQLPTPPAPAPTATQALPQQLPRQMSQYANAQVRLSDLTASGAFSVWTLALRDLSRGPGAQQNHVIALPADWHQARSLCFATPMADQQWWRAQADPSGNVMVCTQCERLAIPKL